MYDWNCHFMYSCVSLNFAWWLLSCEIVLLYVFAVFLQFDNSVFLFLFSLLAYYISFNKDYYYYYGAYRVSVILYRNLLWSPMFFSRSLFLSAAVHTKLCVLFYPTITIFLCLRSWLCHLKWITNATNELRCNVQCCRYTTSAGLYVDDE